MKARWALAMAWLSLPFGARADEVQAVMDRYIAWRGGAAFATLRSFHERGTVQLGGLHGTLEQWQSRDGHWRRNGNLEEISTSEAAAPGVAWTTNASGQIEELPEGGESERRAVYVAFADAAPHGATLSLMPPEQRDGRSWDVVRAQFPGNATYDLFIAPQTGQLWGERITEDRRTRWLRYADWRLVQGVRMPFSEVESGSNEADEEHRRFTAIDINGAMPAKLFARPASVRNWTFEGGSPATEWIDFEFFNDNQIFIPARVNGTAVQLILDSGAGISVLDRGFARQLGLKTSGQLPVTGTGGQATMQIASDVQIQLANLTLRRIRAGVIDLSPISAQMGHAMPFVLGKEVFNSLIVDIDFTHRKIAFHDPQHFSAPAGAVRVVLGRHNDARAVPISVEGRPAVPFDFDLGNNSPLIVYPAYRDQVRLLEGRPQSLSLSGGVGGLIKSTVATLRSISIAGIEMQQIPTDFPDAGDNAVNSDRTAGNVGLPIFSRFRLLTDYPQDALWLVPEAASLSLPFVKDRAGLAAQPAADRLKVLMVAPGSPAAKAGLQEGAEVVAINGQAIDAGYSGSPLSQWAHQAPGTVVTLKMGDGSVQQLTLQDYY